MLARIAVQSDGWKLNHTTSVKPSKQRGTRVPECSTLLASRRLERRWAAFSGSIYLASGRIWEASPDFADIYCRRNTLVQSELDSTILVLPGIDFSYLATNYYSASKNDRIGQYIPGMAAPRPRRLLQPLPEDIQNIRPLEPTATAVWVGFMREVQNTDGALKI